MPNFKLRNSINKTVSKKILLNKFSTSKDSRTFISYMRLVSERSESATVLKQIRKHKSFIKDLAKV